MSGTSQTQAELILIKSIQDKLELALNSRLSAFSLSEYLQRHTSYMQELAKSMHLANTELGKSEIAYNQLVAAIKYSVFSGGKRIRPLLCLLIANYCQTLLSCQIQNKNAKLTNKIITSEREDFATLSLQLAIAIELIHSYSLVHDDLPAMDNAIYRRGKLTVHKQFGEAVAILTGDALLTIALGELSHLQADFTVATYKRILQVQAELVDLAGINGMVSGQMLDLSISTDLSTKADYLACISGKTAALLQASICLPAKLIANLSKESMQNLAKLAYYWGILFQVQDDRLDAEQVNQEKNILQYITAAELASVEKQLCELIQASLQAVFMTERNKLVTCATQQLADLQVAEDALLSVLKQLERRQS